MENYKILDEIMSKKEQRLLDGNYNINLRRVLEAIEKNPRSSFYDAMSKPGLSIIGEIKKASPSKGLIREDFDHIAIALEYEFVVDAVSVLTEQDYFMGSPDYLEQVHYAIDLPLLRKDFIITPGQIFESAELGASAILLIAALIKSKALLKDYIYFAHRLGMDCLVEVHNMEELEVALESGAKIIGINNRDLHDFKENIKTTARLRKHIPADRLVISESSIHTVDDIEVLAKAGVDGILVGESFMRSNNIAAKAKEFKDAYARFRGQYANEY
jgi:indole-3-glycerol phosphate synthase